MLKHQLLHHQLNQSIQSLYCSLIDDRSLLGLYFNKNYLLTKSLRALTIFSPTISPLISIILFCMSGDVDFILELGTVLSR